MTEAQRMYARVAGVKADTETAKAIGLVWAVEQAGNLLDRVKVAKEALRQARIEERSDIMLQRQSQ